MARRSRSRDLAGLAALGALGYTFFGPGRDRKDGTKAPVSDATPVPVERILRDSAAAEPRLQETFMGLDDVSGPQAETGGMGRSDVRAADQSTMPPPAPTVVPTQAVAPVVSPRAAAPRASSQATVPSFGVGAGRSTGRGGATSGELAAYERAQRGAGAGRSTGRGGATAAELAEYQRQQERDRMRGRGYGTTYKKGGSVKAKPKKMASGGMTSASKRADGIATKGKTKCKMY